MNQQERNRRISEGLRLAWKRRKGKREMDRPAAGKLVSATNIDSVRIEVVGETWALTIPLSVILDFDKALKEVREIGDALIVYNTGPMWFAECGGRFYGHGMTPLLAISDMRDRGHES